MGFSFRQASQLPHGLPCPSTAAAPFQAMWAHWGAGPGKGFERRRTRIARKCDGWIDVGQLLAQRLKSGEVAAGAAVKIAGCLAFLLKEMVKAFQGSHSQQLVGFQYLRSSVIARRHYSWEGSQGIQETQGTQHSKILAPQFRVQRSPCCSNPHGEQPTPPVPQLQTKAVRLCIGVSAPMHLLLAAVPARESFEVLFFEDCSNYHYATKSNNFKVRANGSCLPTSVAPKLECLVAIQCPFVFNAVLPLGKKSFQLGRLEIVLRGIGHFFGAWWIVHKVGMSERFRPSRAHHSTANSSASFSCAYFSRLDRACKVWEPGSGP
jgi:hypothetical protein